MDRYLYIMWTPTGIISAMVSGITHALALASL